MPEQIITYSQALRDPRWQKISGIYKIIINDRIYVGSALNIQNRLRRHLASLKANKHINRHLQNAFNKYKKIEFAILELVLFPTELVFTEQKYIDDLKPKYNIAPTAGSQLGFRHSEETKNRLSLMQIGKKISNEQRINISQALIGKKKTDSHKDKISLSKMGDKNPFYKAGENHPQYGIPKSKITKERISITCKERGVQRGDKNPSARCGVLFDAITGAIYVFQSLKPLCDKLGLDYKKINKYLHLKKFYLDRFQACYYPIPKGTKTSLDNINPLVF